MSFSDDFLDTLRQELAKTLGARLAERGLDSSDDLIDAVALDVASDVQCAWAGQQIYVQQVSMYLRRRIYAEFNGNNVPELVRRYRRSTKTIYDYIAAERKQINAAKRLALPDLN